MLPVLSFIVPSISTKPTHMKKKCLLLLSMALTLAGRTQTLIPPDYFGVNHWMPKEFITTPNTPNGPVENANIQSMVLQGGMRLIRIGGADYDMYGVSIGTAMQNDATTNDYIRAIESVRSVNPDANFIVQVPVNAAGFTAANAKTLVARLDQYFTTAISSQFYYSIGNEYDKYPNVTTTFIANTIKAYAVEMKSQNPNIRIVAPSLSSFWEQDQSNVQILPRLIGGSNNTVPAEDITRIITGSPYSFLNNSKYYVDIIDIHSYAQGINGDMSTLNSSNYASWRAQAISFPNTAPGFLDVLNSGPNGLIGLINYANALNNRGASPLKFGVTELNIAYLNTTTLNSSNSQVQNTANSIQCRSFFAGQYWLDMMSSIINNGGGKAAFVQPWSIHESDGDGSTEDLGMTKGFADATTAPTPLSTYYHMQMMAGFCDPRSQYVQNYYYTATTNNGNVKAFAIRAHGRGANEAVFIMNQNESGSLTDTYHVRFDNTPGTGLYNINIPNSPNTVTSTKWQYSGTIGPETTIMLVFNCVGELMYKQEYRETNALNDTPPSFNSYNPSPCRTGTGSDDGGITGPVCPVKFLDNVTYYTNTTIKEDISVTGTIKVPANRELIIDGAYLAFGPNGKIEVMPGGKLTILRSRLSSCDGVIWKGIEVKGNFSPSTSVTIRNSQISNAQTALKADKLSGLVIEGTIFDNGTTALDIDRSRALEIYRNEFYRYDYAIKTSNTVLDVKRSLISQNAFAFIKTVILMDNDNHSRLDITCNKFGSYRDYAIRSTNNTILKDQGTADEGAGNVFESSESVYPNNKLSHNGNRVKYYFDPSLPVAAADMSAIVNPSHMDSPCNIEHRGSGARLSAGGADESGETLYTSALADIRYKLYPNPSSGSMTLDYHINEGDIATFAIYDLTGRQISTHSLSSNSASYFISDDTMSAGMYIFTISVNGNTIITEKIVISK